MLKPAFPRPASEFTKNGTLPDGNDAIPAQNGMSLREYYAGQVISNARVIVDLHQAAPTEAEVLASAGRIARTARIIADALILELDTTRGDADAMLAEREKGGAQ